MADVVQQAALGHKRRAVADGADDFALGHGAGHNRRDGICRRRCPSHSADKHQCRIVLRHILEGVIRDYAQPAYGLYRVGGRRNNAVDVFGMLLECILVYVYGL